MPVPDAVEIPLLFLWLADYSGSMSEGSKIDALNQAIADAIPHIRRISEENPMFPIKMGVIKFSDVASWHSKPVNIHDFQWFPIHETATTTAMDQAIELADIHIREALGQLSIPPVLVLVSDGQPTDKTKYEAALKRFTESPWGAQSRRRAIAIGAAVATPALTAFVAPDNNGVVTAVDSRKLSELIRETSLAVLLDTINPSP